jgi:Bardet-Biedl syndrome 2 protein
LHISAVRDQSDGELLKVTIKCDTLDLAAELVQDMAKYLKISELSSYADFPVELAVFETVLKKVNDSSTARITLAADMADESQLVKALIVRAEDSRLLADMKTMRKAYTQLYALNNQLISNYNLRANNHETLLSSLKEVNNMIQKVANLRVGKTKATLIADCRNAVKANDMEGLLLLLRQGNDSSADVVGNDGKSSPSRRK